MLGWFHDSTHAILGILTLAFGGRELLPRLIDLWDKRHPDRAAKRTANREETDALARLGQQTYTNAGAEVEKAVMRADRADARAIRLEERIFALEGIVNRQEELIDQLKRDVIRLGGTVPEGGDD